MSRKRKRAIATDSMRAMVAMSAAQQRAALPSIEDIRKRYAPPVTLGCSDEDRKIIDLALDAAGVYSVLRHSLTGASFACFPQFMGYGALQNLAQNGMIRACVSTVADDMTREWVEIRRAGEKDDRIEDDELVSSLSAAMEQMCLKKVFHEAVELVGYEGGALIFIDTGAKDTQLALPLDMSPKSAELRKGCSLRFVVIDPVNVAPGTYNADDPLRADYFRPRDWLVLGRRVHASRLIRLVSNEVPILLRPAYNFFGVPQAQILWDYVQHFQENRTAVDRLLTKFSMTVFKTSMFEGGSIFGASDQVRMDERIKFMVQNMSNDGILAIDKNAEDILKLETPLSGLTDIVRQSLELLAAINRTPAVKLLGISPSGFNATGESDLRNYYDHIASMQHKQLFDGIKCALDCLQLHLYGQIDPNISFSFNALSEEDKQIQASTRKTRMETLSLLLDRDVISVEEARKALSEDPDSGFDDIDPEMVPEPQGMPDAGEEDLLGEQGLAGMEVTLPMSAMDEAGWRTAKNGKRYQIDTETGEIVKGNLGQKKKQDQDEWNSPLNQKIRLERVENAMLELENGKSEATVKGLRNDLEQYGGSNDVTFIAGDRQKGLEHIAYRHGHSVIANVLDAVANGKLEKYVPAKKTAHIRKDGYEAVLSLDEHGKKKTWLLTGYKMESEYVKDQKKRLAGDSGKVSTRHASTHAGPMFSRPDMGAANLSWEIIAKHLKNIKNKLG